MRFFLLSLFLFGLPLQAALMLTLSEEQGVTILDVAATGSDTTGNGQAFLLVLATQNDSFLNDGQSSVEESNPMMSLGISIASSISYTDTQGGIFNIQSTIELAFPQPPNAPVASPLTELSGRYELPSWVFSDFNPGSYSLQNVGGNPNFLLEVPGEITLTVVPEPGSSVLLLIGMALCATRRSRIL